MAQKIDAPITTNDLSLDRVLKTGLPLALIFYNNDISASLDLAMKTLAWDYADRILIAKINTKDNPKSTQQFHVHNTPTLVTIKQGSALDQVANVTGAQLEMHVKYLLGLSPKPHSPNQEQAFSKQPSQKTETPRPNDNHPMTVNDGTFDQVVLGSSLPVLVDFWAPWCGPCRMIEPIMDKFVHEMNGKLHLAKVNVDENPILSQRYGIYSIPTMMIVKNGRVVDQWSGAIPEPAIRSRLAKIGLAI